MSDMLTLKQLQYFLALTETGHFRKAAERCGISQPSLSQQLQRLEDCVGMRLVERGRKGAVLTPGGREIISHIKRVFAEIEAMQSIARAARDGVSGTIRLGSSPTLGPYFLPYLTRRLRRTFPQMKVIIRDATPMVLHEELAAGQHDLLLTQLPVHSADMTFERLFREPLKLVVSQEHPLAARSEAQDKSLAGQDVLAMSSAYALHSQIVALCQQVSATLRQDYEGTSLDALRQMTAMNMGVSLLPALYVHSEVRPETGDVAVLRFRKDRFTRSVGLVWRRNSAHTGLIERIADMAREVAREEFKGLIVLE